MTLPTLYLELDTTGAKAANKREFEPHVVPSRTTRVFKPKFGAYFTKSLKVWSIQGATRVPLTRGTDFTCVELFEKLTQVGGHEICGAILVHRPDLPDQFEITYQALGGFGNIDYEGMAVAVRDLYASGNTVEWDDILDKPTAFPPAAHLHDSADLYGMEFLRDAVQNLLYAIEEGTDSVELQLLSETHRSRAETITHYRTFLAAIEAHLINTGNPHGLTKGQIGLGSVENRHFIPRTVNAVVVEPYASPRTTFNLIKNAVLGDILKHIDDHSNPHQVTKTQILLPLVQNYPVGTAADIIAGALAAAFVTPAVVSEAVPQLLGGILAHVARTDDPHNVTALQIGLGNVQNFPMAVATEVAGGISEERYVTPADVKTVTDNYLAASTPLRDNHFNDDEDPHDLTALQVGLEKVQNYALASQADIVAGFAPDLYITPFDLRTGLQEEYDSKLDLADVDDVDGATPLDSLGRIPARLLTNSPDYRLFGLKHFVKGGGSRDLQMLRYVFTRSITFPENFAGSAALLNLGPQDGPMTVEILKGEDVRLGTIVWQSQADVGVNQSKVGTFTTPAGPVSFKIGDVLTLRMTQLDVFASDFSFHLVGTLDAAASTNPTGVLTMMPALTVRPPDHILSTGGLNDASAAVDGLERYNIVAGTLVSYTNAAAQRVNACSFGNSYKGYVLAGKVAGAAVSSFESYHYANASVAVVGGLNIGTARSEAIGFGNENVGVVTGGITTADTFSTATNRYAYAPGTFNVVTSLGLAMARTPGFGPAHHAYIRGGSTLLLEFDGSTYYGKYTYASQVLAVVSTASTLSRFGAMAAGNATVGVVMGGSYQGSALTTTQRTNYATDALSAGTALGDGRAFGAAGGNATLGVFGGGARTTGVVVDTATVYTYADDSTAAATVLGTARRNHATLSSSPGWR